jgi:hypothetical protein
MSILEDRLEREKKLENELKNLIPKYEDLLRVAASVMCDCEDFEKEAKKWEEEWDSNQLIRNMADIPKILKSRGQPYNPDAFIELILDIDCMAIKTHVALTNARSSASALKAANAKHSRLGGSRDKRENICAIWASGKYSSRDICAEQECAALGMSFSIARKALRNTPDPT